MIKSILLLSLIVLSSSSFPRVLQVLRILSSECNNHGYLYKGQCFCLTTWTGAQCQIRKSEGWADNLNSKCDDLVVRLDNLYNISPDFYLFDDDVFPRLTFNSIDGTTNATNTWTKIHSMTKNFSIYSDDISPLDIGQGGLGDCYLLAAYASLANRKNGESIKNIFMTKTDNPNHVYVSQWMIAGKPRYVAVDDWVPGQGGAWYSHFEDEDDAWPLILEKSYAKIHGSYKIIEGGWQTAVWSAITSAPTFNKWHDTTQTPDTIFALLKDLFANDYVVGTATVGQKLNNEVGGHAYSVLGTYEITTDNGTKVKLVRYMNPWHSEVWKTNPWGDSSANWTNYTKSQVPYISGNDGIVFSTVEDYFLNFGVTNWAEVHSDYDVSFLDISLASAPGNVSTSFDAYFNFTGDATKPLYISIFGFDGRLLQGCGNPYNVDSFVVLDPNRQVISSSWGTAKIVNPIKGKYYVKASIKKLQDYARYFTVTGYAPSGTVTFYPKDNNDVPTNVKCPNDCNFQGSCNTLTGQCKCYFGYEGTDCAQIVNKVCNSSLCGPNACDTIFGTCAPTGLYNLGKSSFMAMLGGGWGATLDLSTSFYPFNQQSDASLLSSSNGQCVDIISGSISAGLCTWSCHGGSNQKWNFTYINQTTFLIQPQIDLTYAMVASADGKKVSFAKKNQTDKNQLWTLKANTVACPGGCSGKGVCSISTGKCVCGPGYIGNACEQPEIFTCANNCSGKGTCNKNTGACTCQSGYSGDGCERQILISCPLDCSGNGQCSATTGVCTCKAPFVGQGCDQLDSTLNFTLYNVNGSAYLIETLKLSATAIKWNFLPDGQIRNQKNNNVLDVYDFGNKVVGPWSLNQPSSQNQEFQVVSTGNGVFTITSKINMGYALAFRNGVLTLVSYDTNDKTQQWIIKN